MNYRWIVLVAALGCGRSGFEERVPDARGGSDDAAVDALVDATVDATIDATVTGPCTGTTLVNDPLDDTAAAPLFLAQPITGLTLVEGAGHLDVQFAPTVAANNYANYRSAMTFAAEGLCATIELSQVPTDVASAYVKLRTAQLEVELFSVDGAIHIRTRQANNLRVERIIPLDLVASRFWQIRVLAGTTYWETSPDGLAYTTHLTLAGFFSAASCQVELGAGTQAAATNAGIARFESVRILGP